MSPEQYLKENYREPLPGWLRKFNQRSVFNADDFFGSRVVYYPGSGDDGHAVKVFGSSHSAHCFVYADFAVSRATIERDLSSPDRKFSGYDMVARIALRPTDLTPMRGKSHIIATEKQQWDAHFKNFLSMQVESFAFLEVLKRHENLGEDHGAERLAILFIGADGHAAYDALFCQDGRKAAFAILLQDHSWGGNYSSFGEGGILQSIATRAERLPDILLVAMNTTPWPGYRDLEGLESSVVRQIVSRRLYIK